MYETHWGLREKPFENTPDPRFFYKSANLADTYARLLYALKSKQGALMLTGESGCGKTLLARTLVQELDPERTEIALLTNPNSQSEELMREILYQIGEDESLEDRAQINHRLHGRLFDNFSAGMDTVVIIDEGQLLEDPKVFEELRLFLNFQLNDAFLITLFLVGQPSFAKQVNRYPQLDERLSARAVIRPFEREEVGAYINHRLHIAGRFEPVFSEDAIELIAQYSGGIPRRLNHICDICLVIGYSRQAAMIDEDLVYRLILNEEENRVV